MRWRSLCKLRQVGANEILIRQDGIDNELYFVLAGAFTVIVNGRRVAIRRTPSTVAEAKERASQK